MSHLKILGFIHERMSVRLRHCGCNGKCVLKHNPLSYEWDQAAGHSPIAGGGGPRSQLGHPCM